MGGELPGMPPRTVAEAEEKYLKAVELLFKALDPADIAADPGGLTSHLMRYGNAFAIVELMMDLHQKIMKAVMGTHAAKLPLPSSLLTALPERLPVPEAPSRPSEPPVAVELLRLWMSAWTTAPGGSEKVLPPDGFELMRRTREFLDSRDGPIETGYFISLRWPVLGGMTEQTFTGRLSVDPRSTMTSLLVDVLAKFAEQLKRGIDDLVVLEFGLLPDSIT